MGDEYEAIVIGAGFAGLRMLHELRRLGVAARVLEAGTDVGGTWYWNRYPGARTDSESWVYCFWFDQELLQDWDWNARFPAQEEVYAYLRHAADRLDLRRDIQFSTRVVAAHYDEEANGWSVVTAAGERFHCTYLIAATGFFSVTYEPPFEGLPSFGGDWYQTSRWPKEGVDFTGKRVGVVGTGATGVQVIPEVAHAATEVTVFQRTANYVIPSRNHPLEDHQQRAIKANYGAIWEQCLRQVFAFPIQRTYRFADDFTAEERERIFEAGWETGGFRFIFETFDDITANAQSNEAACEFVRNKIRTIVKDPQTAELLCPQGHPIGAKRIPLGHHYYETFNRDHVHLASVAGNPIERITEGGIRLADGGEYELDAIVFAVGFDAGTGALTQMDVRGRAGRTIAEDWRGGARTYLGMAIEGFPNLFTIAGAHGPLANVPILIDRQVAFVGRAIEHLRDHGYASIEATPQAVDAFAEQLQRLLDGTLLGDAAKVGSYYLGANIPGKAHTTLVYFGGAAKYFKEISAVADREFDGFALA
ncbi:MAG TPA: NAD(P)/FAD-dependent oxidoreductase [Solirubrobacteraceae bacterium]|nr:NAD(P)/FAD-dependent oxidoreductase [Solirubrobacteraceae bacterium]